MKATFFLKYFLLSVVVLIPIFVKASDDLEIGKSERAIKCGSLMAKVFSNPDTLGEILSEEQTKYSSRLGGGSWLLPDGRALQLTIKGGEFLISIDGEEAIRIPVLGVSSIHFEKHIT